MVAKSKYETHVLPKLFLIECWARDGIIDKDIAKKLGVAYSTFRVYIKDFSALSAALKKGKEIVDYEVENALLRKAKGYNAEVRKTFKLKEVYYDEEGRRCEKEYLESAIDEVHIPPDTLAGIFWLKNRKPDKWKDKPVGDDSTSGQLENLIKGLQQNE